MEAFIKITGDAKMVITDGDGKEEVFGEGVYTAPIVRPGVQIIPKPDPLEFSAPAFFVCPGHEREFYRNKEEGE